jgi:hypothetical protein
MITILRFFRSNAVAFVALFIALGGVGWAATSLPAGSVGARQIQNHSITPEKFNQSMIGGSVRYWARISADGKVVASSQPKARIVAWYTNPTGFYGGGVLRWGKPIAPGCFSLATAESFPRSISVSAQTVAGNGRIAQVRLALPAIVPVDVAVICPAP